MIDKQEPAVQAETSPVLLVPEGRSLHENISARARAGLPAWRIYSLFVPRVPFTAGNGKGLVIPTSAVGIPCGCGRIHNTVAASLAQRAPWPHEWSAHERSQQRQFYIAALEDLVGVKHDDDPQDDRVATSRDRDRRIGREMWAKLGAWPWSLFGPEGILPCDWRQDASVVTVWRHWEL